MDIRKNVSLAQYTTFGIGGPADEFVVVKSSDELIEAIQYAKSKNIPFFVLGTGANILVGDKGFRGLVIKNEASKFVIASDSEAISIDKIATSPSASRLAPESTQGAAKRALRIPRNDNSILFTAESGAVMSDLIEMTMQKGLSGFEHFAGIPSTIGGALWQNLHFLSSNRKETMFIGDILESAQILPIPIDKIATSPSASRLAPESTQGAAKRALRIPRNDVLETRIVNKSYFHFGYDTSSLHTTRDVVLSAMFVLSPEDPHVIQERITANLLWRQEKHPEDATSCSAGSIFRKIKDRGAGRLIEQVGLKGHTIGGAKISDRHANFIINTGGATARNVVDLIDLVKKKVYDDLGLKMELEISLVGEF